MLYIYCCGGHFFYMGKCIYGCGCRCDGLPSTTGLHQNEKCPNNLRQQVLCLELYLCSSEIELELILSTLEGARRELQDVKGLLEILRLQT